MATLDQVADYILWTAQKSGEPVSNLKLQKLVYYAQAWSLALRDKPIFEGKIEAWIHGPVVRKLYHRFKVHGSGPITTAVSKPDLDPDEKQLLDDVLNVYLGFSSWDLERLTHAEAPWVEARGNIAPDAPSDAEILPETMKQFYRARAEASADEAREPA